MNYTKIKEEARNKIKGNIWKLILPSLIVFAIQLVVTLCTTDFTDLQNTSGDGIASLVTIALYPIEFGIIVYYLDFVRGKDVQLKDIFGYYKQFGPIFLLFFLIGLFTTLWTLLLIIPGIIAAIKYSMAPYIMADGETDAMTCINKSKVMMNGYKGDYFCFKFSFIGWFLLCLITFGIAYIYVFPYMKTADALYYEELKKIS